MLETQGQGRSHGSRRPWSQDTPPASRVALSVMHVPRWCSLSMSRNSRSATRSHIGGTRLRFPPHAAWTFPMCSSPDSLGRSSDTSQVLTGRESTALHSACSTKISDDAAQPVIPLLRLIVRLVLHRGGCMQPTVNGQIIDGAWLHEQGGGGGWRGTCDCM